MPLPKSAADPLVLARSLEAFLAAHPQAAVLDQGRVIFDLTAARYALSTEHGRCVLHLWSEERNLVRTVVGVEQRKDRLRLLVRRMGAERPQSLDFVAGRDFRAPGARGLSRSLYVRLLERVLCRVFSDYKVENLRSAMDLENSFGPAYTRGILHNGQRTWAVIGTGAAETPATIDGILTLGILWLAHCRQHTGGKSLCQGLKVIVPRGSASVTQARMACLHPKLGGWELYELCETTEELARVDTSTEGNLKMRLVEAFDPQAAMARASAGLDRIMRLLPEGMKRVVEVRAFRPGEVALALHGLEFARVKQVYREHSFTREDAITFGAGANETALDDSSEAQFQELAQQLFFRRSAAGSMRDPLFRLQAEGWLESVVRQDPARIEPSFESSPVYSQVPAFAAADRGVLDLLTATKDGRLAVLELKADEDLHLPLQALDYWLRVRRLNEQRDAGVEGARRELERIGYFPGMELSGAVPLLYFVIPALRVHPSMEMVLAHFSPEIPWTLVAVGEEWRNSWQVVFRKRA
ncbi:MAG TPA: hypothetical protein VHX11_08830 [Acidobacteriaceae bacterium]|nr:hypothetical protein [Acidobacteriaceae bacterium]